MFFIFIFSLNLAEVNRFISFTFLTIMELKIRIIRYITPKQRIVFIKASIENINLNPVKSTLKSFAVTTDSPCDKNIPNIRPNAKEITPIIIVSINNKEDNLEFSIPKVI